jgi:hypothetical protein
MLTKNLCSTQIRTDKEDYSPKKALIIEYSAKKNNASGNGRSRCFLVTIALYNFTLFYKDVCRYVTLSTSSHT